MITREEAMTAGGVDGDSNFLGDDQDYRDWFCGPSRSRDSGCLAESNFEAALKSLGGESGDVRVERFGHWGVGWVEQIYVRPRTKAAEELAKLEAALENYPVLDDEDYSNRETESANEVWRDCFSQKQRLSYMRKHRDEFECDYAELRANVRGDRFSGYASNILS